MRAQAASNQSVANQLNRGEFIRGSEVQRRDQVKRSWPQSTTNAGWNSSPWWWPPVLSNSASPLSASSTAADIRSPHTNRTHKQNPTGPDSGYAERISSPTDRLPPDDGSTWPAWAASLCTAPTPHEPGTSAAAKPPCHGTSTAGKGLKPGSKQPESGKSIEQRRFRGSEQGSVKVF